MAIWVPPKVAEEAADARREYEHNIGLVAEKRHVCNEWDRELQKIDPHLSLFFAPDWANVPGVIPGRYHILNKREHPTVIPVTGALGEFVEPGSQMLDMLRADDMWNDVAGRDRAKKEQALAEAKANAKVREKDDRQEELRDRLKSTFNPGVSFSKAGPWSYRAGAKKRAA